MEPRELLPQSGLQEVARAEAYGFLAALFSRPSEERHAELLGAIPKFIAALKALSSMHELRHACGVLTTLLRQVEFEKLSRDWYSSFDPSGGLLVPPTETHYTADSPSHGMTRGYEMADVAAFYEAFEVNVSAGTERPDHIVAELDFLHLLAVKTAVAIAEDNDEAFEVCRSAREKFLVDHVVRWVGLFCQLLNETEEIGPVYPAAGRLLLVFLQDEVLNSCQPES